MNEAEDQIAEAAMWYGQLIEDLREVIGEVMGGIGPTHAERIIAALARRGYLIEKRAVEHGDT